MRSYIRNWAMVIMVFFSAYFMLADAFKSIKKKAEQGDAEAQFNLGKTYDNGKGVPQDYQSPLVMRMNQVETARGDSRTYFRRRS